MRALLAELGDPQDAYPAIHVVGTNGKSTATVTIEQLLLSEGLSVGSTISPHVASWSERIRLTEPRRTSRRRSRVSGRAAERVQATQFEIVTAAALAAFAAGGRRCRGRRGGPRRAARRDERAPHARRPAHERRARAHRRARRHARGDRAREARGRAGRTRSSCFRTTRTRISCPDCDDPTRRRARGRGGVRRSRDRGRSARLAPRSARAAGRRDPRRCAQSRRCALPRRAASDRATTRSSSRSWRTRTRTRCSASFVEPGSRLVATSSSSDARASCRRARSPRAWSLRSRRGRRRPGRGTRARRTSSGSRCS